MYCSECGKENDAGYRFCDKCGNPLISDVPFASIPNEKRCPRCQNMCHQDSLSCAVCGYSFLSYAPANNFAPQQKTKNTANTCKYAAIALLVLNVLLNVFSLVAVLTGTNPGASLSTPLLYMTLPIILIIIGLLIGKNNVLPGIGYLLLILANLLPFIIFDSDFSYFIVFNWIAYAMVSVLFFVKIGFIKKLWFVPAISSGIYVICFLIESVSFGGYYGWGYLALTLVVSAIGCMIPFGSLLFAGYAAKELWVTDASPVNPITQNSVDYSNRI